MTKNKNDSLFSCNHRFVICRPHDYHLDLHLILIRLRRLFKSMLRPVSDHFSEFSSVFKVIDLMELVAAGKTSQPKATKDEVFSVELQTQVGKLWIRQLSDNKLRLFRWSKWYLNVMRKSRSWRNKGLPLLMVRADLANFLKCQFISCVVIGFIGFYWF